MCTLQVAWMWDCHFCSCLTLDLLSCKMKILVAEPLRGPFQLKCSLFLHVGLWLLKKSGRAVKKNQPNQLWCWLPTLQMFRFEDSTFKRPVTWHHVTSVRFPRSGLTLTPGLWHDSVCRFGLCLHVCECNYGCGFKLHHRILDPGGHLVESLPFLVHLFNSLFVSQDLCGEL